MHSLLFWSLTMAPLAQAAPVGDPVAHPGAGRVRVDARVGSERIEERDVRCTGATGCDVSWRRREVVAGLHIAILRGLGIYGELGRETGRIQAADYLGTSQVWAAGLRGAIPLGRDWLIAMDGRFGFGHGEEVQEDGLSDPEVERYEIHTVSLLGVWGDPEKGGDAWFGAQGAWHWEHEVWPLGQNRSDVVLDIPLAPKVPVAGVLGGALYSEPFGLPWRSSMRMNVAIEGRIGQVNAVTGWVGAAF